MDKSSINDKCKEYDLKGYGSVTSHIFIILKNQIDILVYQHIRSRIIRYISSNSR